MIGHLEKMFCDFGIPQTLLSDNEAQYGSSEFCDFAKRMHMQHTTSSARYPQSNRMAERVSQTIKRSLTKMLGDGKSLLQTLAAVCSTPIGDGLPSPAKDNANDVSGERVCPDTTQSSGNVEQPPNNSPSRTVRSEEPTLRRSERASVRPKHLQDFVSS